MIAGARDGYFRAGESDAVAAAVRASGANVLLAGLGSPKQEHWLARYLAATGCGVGIGIGGSLDVYAGNVVRAPAAFRRTGLEWAYRLVDGAAPLAPAARAAAFRARRARRGLDRGDTAEKS